MEVLWRGHSGMNTGSRARFTRRVCGLGRSSPTLNVRTPTCGTQQLDQSEDQQASKVPDCSAAGSQQSFPVAQCSPQPTRRPRGQLPFTLLLTCALQTAQETSAICREIVPLITRGLGYGYKRWMGPATVVPLTPLGEVLCRIAVAFCAPGAGVPCKDS